MEFLSFVKFKLRSIVAETKALKSIFFSLKAVESLQNLLNSLFSNISCSFLQENLHSLRIAKFYVFCVFLEIMKNGLKHLVAVTPSYNACMAI